ncbi:MAG: HAD-IIIC family phosphatase [Bacteroidales bacterium]|jgi:FkbH-like protein|nr:HAD-IIIC family phosphatase [Bacteroidales bacterium]
MNYFIFRNNTIEIFFPKGYSFSGYDDISYIPSDVDGYLWFYQIPIKYDLSNLVSEIKSYIQKLSFVLERIDKNKPFIALTIDDLYSVVFSDDDFRLASVISDYNNFLFDAEQKYPNLKVIDIRDFYRQYRESELIDWKFYFISQMGLSPRLLKPFQTWFKQKLNEIDLKRKKCIVLDLDNTLWGGVLGEDGIDGIKIGGDYPGKAFLYFQEALLNLSKYGVILTVCSKNNEQDVFDVWEKNPFIVLRKEHFAAYRINWNDKATNIRELAEELNIGLDSFVFIDDNPTERELVKQSFPMIAVPDFPEQPYELPVFFKSVVDSYFKVYSITKEDRNKTKQYKANALRVQAEKSFTDFNKFLESLDIKIIISAADEFNIPRIAQMTQKTNQFNLTTKRYTDVDINEKLANGCKVYCISVSDKFGDNGITGCIIFNGNEIDSLLLSCRILGKGIERAFIKTILNSMKEQGIKEVKAQYIPTAKNVQVKDFYEKCGFTCISETAEGIKNYVINLDNADLKVESYYNTIKLWNKK